MTLLRNDASLCDESVYSWNVAALGRQQLASWSRSFACTLARSCAGRGTRANLVSKGPCCSWPERVVSRKLNASVVLTCLAASCLSHASCSVTYFTHKQLGLGQLVSRRGVRTQLLEPTPAASQGARSLGLRLQPKHTDRGLKNCTQHPASNALPKQVKLTSAHGQCKGVEGHQCGSGEAGGRCVFMQSASSQ